MTTEFVNWAEKYHLEDLRRLSLDRTELIAEITDGKYAYLAAEIVMFREAYEALKPWEQACARAFAEGMGADRAVVSGKAAARIWGLEVIGVDERTELTYVHPTRPTRKAHWPPGVVFLAAHLGEDEVVEAHGVRVAKVSRTLKDVTRYYGLEDGVVTIDSARKLWPRLTREILTATLCGLGRYRGKELVRKAISWSVPNSGSALESRARVQILESGLVDPELVRTQVPLVLPGYGRVLLDICVGPVVVAEVDGRIKYDGVSFGKPAGEVIRAEREREKAINNSGRIVVRAGFESLARRQDGGSQFIDDLKGALRRATPLSA